MTKSELAELKERLKALVKSRRILSAHATIYLSHVGGTLLPDGFRQHITPSEHADIIADVEAALKGEPTPSA